MNVNVNINVQINVTVNLYPVIEALDGLREPVQSAMADAMYGIVMGNFGESGLMRPWEWQALSSAYAKRVGRTYATLYVTGALKSTVTKSSDSEAGRVGMANSGLVPYAMRHHKGDDIMPSRRVFPLDSGNDVLQEAVKIVQEAACAKVQEVFA